MLRITYHNHEPIEVPCPRCDLPQMLYFEYSAAEHAGLEISGVTWVEK